MKRGLALLLILALALGGLGATAAAESLAKNSEAGALPLEEVSNGAAKASNGADAVRTPSEASNGADVKNERYLSPDVGYPDQVNLHIIGTTVTIQWQAVSGVDFYEVWDRCPADSGSYVLLGTTSKTSYTVTSATGRHRYLVAGGIYSGSDTYVSETSRYRELNLTNTLQPPTSLKASVSGKNVTLTWNRQSAANSYVIKEKTAQGWKQIATTSGLKKTVTRTAGSHTLGVASVSKPAAGVVIESEYIRYVNVTVKGASTDPEPATGSARYYALLIGEATFTNEYASRNEYDVKNMAAMLQKVKGPSGAAWSVTRKIDAGYGKIQSLINSKFKNARKNDICLFFIATHGNSYGDGELAMNSKNSSRSFLDFGTLATWLNRACKGRVIVIIESCGAGSAIYDPYDTENAAAEGLSFADEMSAVEERANGTLIQNQPGPDAFNAASFVEKAVSAFARVDPGIELEEEMTEETLEDTPNIGAGAMRTSKFYVLAAARHHEQSYGTESAGRQGNYFTKWLIEGVGSKASSPADTNKNRIITLKEAFAWLKKNYRTPGGNVQHAQVYPKNSSFQMFKLVK